MTAVPESSAWCSQVLYGGEGRHERLLHFTSREARSQRARASVLQQQRMTLRAAVRSTLLPFFVVTLAYVLRSAVLASPIAFTGSSITSTASVFSQARLTPSAAAPR